MSSGPLGEIAAPARPAPAGVFDVPWRAVLALALLPSVLAVLQLGRIHPDEVYQSLEPAYHRAFGYGVLAWEWQGAGLRNWAIPLLFSWLLRLCAMLGIDHPQAYRAVLAVPQVVLNAFALAAVYRYAARRVTPGLAMVAMVAVGLYAPWLVFAGRTLGESFSTSFFVVAVELLDRPTVGARAAVVGGVMAGWAVVARYGSAVLVAALVVWLLATRRWRALACTALGGGLVALALGGLDWATWGKPFHSLFAYVEFNLLSGKAASQFGQEGAAYYLPVLAQSAPLFLWLGFPLAMRWQRPVVSLPLFAGLAYLMAITLTPHKEHRFLYPALVLLTVAALPGVLAGLARLRRGDLRAALASLLLAMAVGPFFLSDPALSVHRADQFRGIVRITRGEATGLLIVGEGIWGAGGFFYLGKNIPWLTCDFPHDFAFQQAMANRAFNRAVTYDERALAELKAHGFREVERIGRAATLARP